jgi:hypothetical protein
VFDWSDGLNKKVSVRLSIASFAEIAASPSLSEIFKMNPKGIPAQSPGLRVPRRSEAKAGGTSYLGKRVAEGK